FIALQGIHAMLEPGIYPLRLTAALPDGSQQSFEQMVLVVSGNYLDEVIPVHADTINPTVDKAEDEWLLSRTTQVTPERYWNGLFLRPSTFPDVSSWFGTRRLYIATEDPNITKTGFHSGIDYIGGEGLPITAPAAGKVIFTGLKDIRGYSTIIDHGQGVYSGFWHQSEIQVQPGDFVEAGQQIGLVGGTGRSTGAHQHWEIWVNGVQVNPLEWLEKTFP
ncbi:MAG: M23 family metallopeptidase, partial [Anaerolineales bacterium]|nr:M23 family metallopeptidase [Anaerolineales bacterium]